MSFSPVPQLVEELRQGHLIVLVDDEDRENEGDLALAAERVTPEAINFMATEGRGLVCLPMAGAMVDRLRLPLQAQENTSRFGTAFTVSIDAACGVTTGISARDRATTVLTAIRDDARPEDLVRPGHVFPLRAQDGGVLVRAGQTEGIVDLCKLAGLKPAGVICEIMNPDGTMARLPQLRCFAERHGLKLGSVEDVIEYRRRHEKLVRREFSIRLPSQFGEWDLHLYASEVDRNEHIALTMGFQVPDPSGPPLSYPLLVRVHSECLTGDLLGSHLCDCGSQLQFALRQIAAEGKGVLVYMRQEGRGIGLANKLRAYHLQQTRGLDTVEANQALGFPPDVRHYGIGAQILRDLGVRKIRLLTNNPRKYLGLKGYNLEIVERVGIEIPPRDENRRYLQTKKEKLGHFLTELDSIAELARREPEGGREVATDPED
ncbi:MAG: bifunctional 3,4-dihydroxy-2-butanone-4-phosphate synthase/GTP cyclohydrolase II [Planctomycetota bacterium]